MTPLRWLHMTTLLAGPAADFSPDKLRQMTQTAADLLADTPPPAVTLGQVLYHPEAIMLGEIRKNFAHLGVIAKKKRREAAEEEGGAT